jgi:hypothetical protein
MKKDTTEPVRIDKLVVELVRDNKKNTGVSISRFIEDAIKEKINYGKNK